MLGAPFYVMERVDGVAYRRAAELDALGAERTAAIAGRLVEVLAALHAVDPDAVGLAEFGRPEGFLERQVRRWGKQLEGSKTREHPDADELHRRLTDAGEPRSGRPVGARDRARRLPARQLPGRQRRPRSTPSSTGRWPRSATPAPTSR